LLFCHFGVSAAIPFLFRVMCEECKKLDDFGVRRKMVIYTCKSDFVSTFASAKPNRPNNSLIIDFLSKIGNESLYFFRANREDCLSVCYKSNDGAPL